MRTSAGFRKTAAAVLFSVAVLLILSSAASAPPSPRAWDVRMTVAVRGEYSREGLSRAAGRYRVELDWTGGLETDDDDYVLVHGRSVLRKWEAEESLTGPDGIRLLTTGDFGDKPELRVVYVVRKDDGLHVNFIVRGFDVPRSDPGAAFYLHLPASAENSDRPGGLNYNLFVRTGTNAVVLDDPATLTAPRQQRFRWKWARRTGVVESGPGLFETNGHEAEVTVVVTPRT